jgi:hypothetical protein
VARWNWLGWGLIAVSAVLWIAYIWTWDDLAGRMLERPDGAHPHAYQGHSKTFYVTDGDLYLLRTLMVGAGIFVWCGSVSLLYAHASTGALFKRR